MITMSSGAAPPIRACGRRTAMINHVMDETYRAGACNIGPAEIARRRRSAIALTTFALVVAVALIASGIPVTGRVLLLPFAAGAAVTWLQVIRRFCVAFGAVGIRNFGALGTPESVGDSAARAADRRTAIRMIVEGSLYGLIITAVVMLLPV
jgi:hypothetical protein